MEEKEWRGEPVSWRRRNGGENLCHGGEGMEGIPVSWRRRNGGRTCVMEEGGCISSCWDNLQGVLEEDERVLKVKEEVEMNQGQQGLVGSGGRGGVVTYRL